MNKNLILRYSGDGIRDNSIEVEDLITGLKGLVKLSSVVLNELDPKIAKTSSLRVKGFQEGSFETVLIFIEQHPTLVTNTTYIIVAVAGALAYFIRKKEKPKNLDVDSLRVLEAILEDDKKFDNCKKAFSLISFPLQSGKIDALEFGLEGELHKLIDESSMHDFIDVCTEDTVHKPITLEGQLRSLDKKTLNGKFITNNNETYPITLVMDDYENYFNYFNESNMTIQGVATYEKGESLIKKIEINDINTIR